MTARLDPLLVSSEMDRLLEPDGMKYAPPEAAVWAERTGGNEDANLDAKQFS